MANTENIEAKLCAYIDGELDEQGRAEIEKHLAANPQHRGLIEELSTQRQMLRALPRESAPDEIMETLQGQLERAGLLGDDRAAEVDAAAMRINRWPQVMAAAAIVLLAVGLVGIIYFVLPRQGGGNDAYVIGEVPSGDDAAAKLRMSTTGEAADSDPPAPGGGEAFARRDVSEKREEVAMKTAETPAAALPAAPTDPLDATPAATGQATPAPTEMAYAPKKDDPFEARPGKAGEADAVATSIGTELKQAQERLFSADLTRQLQNKPGGIQQNSMVVFVCASDANAANGEVANYLASNGIQYEDVAEGPPAPLDEAVTRDMHLSKNAPTRVQSKSMTFRQATQSPDVSVEQTVTLPPPPQAAAGAAQEPNVVAKA